MGCPRKTFGWFQGTGEQERCKITPFGKDLVIDAPRMGVTPTGSDTTGESSGKRIIRFKRGAGKELGVLGRTGMSRVWW